MYMDMSYGCNMMLRQLAYGDIGLFPRTVAMIQKYGLDDILARIAEKLHYYDYVDFLLCRMFPVLEAECQEYYRGGSARFAELHPGAAIPADAVISADLERRQKNYRRKLRAERMRKACAVR